MFRTVYERSPFGQLDLVADESGRYLTGLWVAGEKHYGEAGIASIPAADGIGVFAEVKDWLDSYFAGERPDPAALALAPAGSDFRREVWQLLLEIPYGGVTTYGALANIIADRRKLKKMASQAVGGAVGHNPISIIIPCHRVVGANGSLTGYGGGLAMKIRLLEHEGVDVSRFFIPTRKTAR